MDTVLIPPQESILGIARDRYRDWKYCPRNEEIRSSRNRLSSLARKWDPAIMRIVDAKSEVIIPPQKGFPMGIVDHLVWVEVRVGDMYHFTEKRKFSFLIEIKSFIKSEGEVLRQIRLYQERYRDAIIVLVTRDPLDTASQARAPPRAPVAVQKTCHLSMTSA